MMDARWFTELNDKQKEAVMHDQASLFVVAGAGTGKTKTLTARIAYLISQKQVVPSRILAVTFTNKAAREMKERLVSMIGRDALPVWIYTFHAFSVQVLRKYIDVLPYGLSLNFNIIDEEDARQIVKEAIKSLNLDTKVYPIKRMRGKISQYKTKKQESTFDDDQEKRIYEVYQKHLLKSNLTDFDDLLIYTLELFKGYPMVLNYYQEHFQYILVDEFQDTDFNQYQILSLLAGHHKQLFVVGDPDQSIYSFRGADYENTNRFKHDFGATHVLDLNYRSTTSILDVANHLITYNKNRPFRKELTSSLGEGVGVIFRNLDSDYQEVAFVLKEIDQLIRYKNYRYEDIAILYRNNALSRLFEEGCIQFGIPYVIYGGISFYERREIKDVLAYVRTVLQPHQDFYLKRIINAPKRGIGKQTIDTLEAYANQMGMSMFDSIESVALSAGTKQKLTQFKVLIETLSNQVETMTSLKDILTEIMVGTGYIDMIKEEQDDLSEERLDHLNELKNVFSQAEYSYVGSAREKMIALLDQIALYTDLDKKNADDNVVKLSTFHQVKGLEFKVVFMVVMEEGIFPSERSFESASDLEEERRIAYVGITRAKELLYLTSSRQRMLYGSLQFFQPSRFLQEAKVVKKETHVRPFDNKEVNSGLKVGDKVMHEFFLEGVVVQLDEDIATIAFKMPHGIKKIFKNHPSLKVI